MNKLRISSFLAAAALFLGGCTVEVNNGNADITSSEDLVSISVTAVSDEAETEPYDLPTEATPAVTSDGILSNEAEQSADTEPEESAEPAGTSAEMTSDAASETEAAVLYTEAEPAEDWEVILGESYSDPYDVAEYIHLYEELPPNFITKKDAQELGWDSRKGNLWDVAPGMSIGGDSFGNREGLLPKQKGRKYTECDVNYEGGFRGGERVVFSNDGLIFYTNDHYESFEQLY